MNDSKQKFMEGLRKLTEETGIAVSSCGCCDGIWLDDAKLPGQYEFSNQNDFGEVSFVAWTFRPSS